MQKDIFGCWKRDFDKILFTYSKNKILNWISGWTRWATRLQPAQFRWVGRLPSNRTQVDSLGVWQPGPPVCQRFGLDPDPDPKWRSGTVANSIHICGDSWKYNGNMEYHNSDRWETLYFAKEVVGKAIRHCNVQLRLQIPGGLLHKPNAIVRNCCHIDRADNWVSQLPLMDQALQTAPVDGYGTKRCNCHGSGYEWWIGWYLGIGSGIQKELVLRHGQGADRSGDGVAKL